MTKKIMDIRESSALTHLAFAIIAYRDEKKGEAVDYLIHALNDRRDADEGGEFLINNTRRWMIKALDEDAPIEKLIEWIVEDCSNRSESGSASNAKRALEWLDQIERQIPELEIYA